DRREAKAERDVEGKHTLQQVRQRGLDRDSEKHARSRTRDAEQRRLQEVRREGLRLRRAEAAQRGDDVALLPHEHVDSTADTQPAEQQRRETNESEEA